MKMICNAYVVFRIMRNVHPNPNHEANLCP